jgi:hypothetical protein
MVRNEGNPRRRMGRAAANCSARAAARWLPELRRDASLRGSDRRSRQGRTVADSAEFHYRIARPRNHLVLPDSFTAKLAIAMFESDHAGTVARVADDGKGGIGTDEARQRLVWRSGEDQRAQYMREAAALLKRAGQL